MKRIAMIGLYTIPNMGDKILCETTSFLTKMLRDDVEIKEIDACPRYKKDYQGVEYIKYRFARLMIILGGIIFKYENKSALRYYYEYFMWWLRLNRYYHKQLRDVDAIIFAGGGFLKYRTQGLNYYVEQIIKIANKKHIPIMMNSVGIEGYDEYDIRCQKLKRQINRECMKVITTRDDYEILKRNFLTNTNIQSDRVGDPALWIPECYGIQRQHASKRIGINVIRGNIYQDYGYRYSPQELKDFYVRLIREAIKRGYEWRLFSNGMKSDQKFGVELITEMGLPAKEYLLPAPQTSEDLIQLVGSFSCILGARLHASITSYAMDVPAIGLIWNEKIRFFSNIIGKKDNFFEEDQLDVETMMNKMEIAMHESYDIEIRNSLKASTKRYLEVFLCQYV